MPRRSATAGAARTSAATPRLRECSGQATTSVAGGRSTPGARTPPPAAGGDRRRGDRTRRTEPDEREQLREVRHAPAVDLPLRQAVDLRRAHPEVGQAHLGRTGQRVVAVEPRVAYGSWARPRWSYAAGSRWRARPAEARARGRGRGPRHRRRRRRHPGSGHRRRGARSSRTGASGARTTASTASRNVSPRSPGSSSRAPSARSSAPGRPWTRHRARPRRRRTGGGRSARQDRAARALTPRVLRAHRARGRP